MPTPKQVRSVSVFVDGRAVFASRRYEAKIEFAEAKRLGVSPRSKTDKRGVVTTTTFPISAHGSTEVAALRALRKQIEKLSIAWGNPAVNRYGF